MRIRCSVCNHPQRAEIEAAHVAGAGVRTLAERFDFGKSTIAKHLRICVPASMAKAREAAAESRDVDAGDALLKELEWLKSESKRLQALAEKKKDYRAAMTAIERLTRLVEVQARIMGQIRDTEINLGVINLDPETALRMAEIYQARHSRKQALTRVSTPLAHVNPALTLLAEAEAEAEAEARIQERSSDRSRSSDKADTLPAITSHRTDTVSSALDCESHAPKGAPSTSTESA